MWFFNSSLFSKLGITLSILDFKEVKSSIKEVHKIKDDIDLKDKFKSEINSIKETSDIIDKEVKDFKNISNK